MRNFAIYLVPMGIDDLMTIIETERLCLRTWRQTDAEIYYLINQDPKVTECLPGPLTVAEIGRFISLANKQQEERGYCFFALELKRTRQLIGFTGLNYVDFEAHFTPAVEIGWRLGSNNWGQGYATEAAKACVDYAFHRIDLARLVSFTVEANTRSLRVMERIGMQRDPEGDFVHPKIEPNHRLSKHVLYRINRPQSLYRNSRILP